MFARLYKLIRPSAQPSAQPDEPKPLYEPEPLYEPLCEEDEERLTQRLYELDRSPTQFPERLNELLQDGEWMEDIQRLSQHKLVELIDYLDNVRFISIPSKSHSSFLQILNGLDHRASPFREGLHALQEICSSQTILPRTYEVSGKLSSSTTEPVTIFRMFSEIPTLSLDGVDVCVKRFWERENPTKAKLVPHFNTVFC